VLFASLPTGASAEALARVPKDVKIVTSVATTATSRVGQVVRLR
jgi:hypothetical protein